MFVAAVVLLLPRPTLGLLVTTVGMVVVVLVVFLVPLPALHPSVAVVLCGCGCRPASAEAGIPDALLVLQPGHLFRLVVVAYRATVVRENTFCVGRYPPPAPIPITASSGELKGRQCQSHHIWFTEQNWTTLQTRKVRLAMRLTWMRLMRRQIIVIVLVVVAVAGLLATCPAIDRGRCIPRRPPVVWGLVVTG